MTLPFPAALRQPVTNAETGKAWLTELVAANLVFHLEDDPTDIVMTGSDETLFSEEDAQVVWQRVEELYSLPRETWGGCECPIGYMMMLEKTPRVRVEFPDYPIDTLPSIPDGFVDQSWHNDACPHFHNKEMDLFFYVDYPKAEDREFPESPRFSLHHSMSDFTDCFLQTDDWSKIVAYLNTRGMNL